MARNFLQRSQELLKSSVKTMEENRVLEGVFAISKPPSLSSAQVLRDLQNRFATSKTFASLLESTKRKQEQDRHQSKRRRRDNDQFFKMGHGGTLDPLATGVLIVGIGRGTKTLQDFLGCTKQYDTVVLFGKSTDTYDICGKIVGERPHKQITRARVEEKLAPFRGEIKQVPPVYSALKINGIKAYEYARSGKELPRELESRDMVVDECTLVDYYDGGSHDFRWPADEAPEDEKAAVQKLMQGATTSTEIESDSTSKQQDQTLSESTADVQVDAPTKEPSSEKRIDTPSKADRNAMSPSAKASLHTHDLPTLTSEPAAAPAARVRLQVSSGFYVRSFAHDLGLSLGSYGIMAELIRTRQQKYTTISPAPPGLTTALTYADLDAGEEVWGPKISAMLEEWMEKNPVVDEKDRIDDRDKPERSKNYKGPRDWKRPGGNRGERKWNRNGNDRGAGQQSNDTGRETRRRNSSSPE